ncbi:MAG: heme exporter protein CcmB [Actinomycetota bacterium]|nr:heme exporter protein CcmB [Actinomycetota bacterium]
MTLLRQTLAVAGKDLRVEVRGRYALGAVLPFAATLLIAFGLSLGPGRTLLRETAPGLLWLAVLFAAVLASRRAYEAEAEDGAMEGLLLAPVDKAAVFLGKAAGVAAQLVVLEAVVLLMVSALFDLPVTGSPGTLAAALLLGTVGLAAVGALFGALDVSARAREAVFPLLVLPLATPILVAGVKATALAVDGKGASSWLGLLVAFDLVIVAAGTLVYGYLLED